MLHITPKRIRLLSGVTGHTWQIEIWIMQSNPIYMGKESHLIRSWDICPLTLAWLCILKNRNSKWLATNITTNKTRWWSCQKWFHLTMHLVHSLARQKWFTFSNRDLGNLGVALILVLKNKGVTIIITYRISRSCFRWSHHIATKKPTQKMASKNTTYYQ